VIKFVGLRTWSLGITNCFDCIKNFSDYHHSQLVVNPTRLDGYAAR
jgi:hypothetical protein